MKHPETVKQQTAKLATRAAALKANLAKRKAQSKDRGRDREKQVDEPS